MVLIFMPSLILVVQDSSIEKEILYGHLGIANIKITPVFSKDLYIQKQ